MRRYLLKNLHCSDCASDLEEKLRKLPTVRHISVNYVTKVMALESDEPGQVVAAVERILPGLEVEGLGGAEAATPSEARPAYPVILGIVLFFVGLLVRSQAPSPSLQHLGEFVLVLSYFISGRTVLVSALRNFRYGKLMNEHTLMTIATGGALSIGALGEAAGVMLFYQVGEYLEALSVGRSRRSIEKLLAVRPDYANVERSGRVVRVAPEEVVVGERIMVSPGEKVPLDGEVIQGSTWMDASALTGESRPRRITPGAQVLAGMINKSSMVRIRVTRPFGESSASKMLDLIENATATKSETEKFMTRFARRYTPVVVGAALAVAVLPPLLSSSQAFSTWIYRALVLLVISCPCALVISIPLAYFGALGAASRRGILVKGANYIDTLGQLRTVVFDKTGTLTIGSFEVTKVEGTAPFGEHEVLELAAMAESVSLHPVAESIRRAWGSPVARREVYSAQEIAGRGVKAVVKGKTVLAGSDRLLHDEGIEHPHCRVEGTVVHVAVDGTYAGYLVIADRLREDARRIVPVLKSLGVREVMMLTGDEEPAARQVAQAIGIDRFYSGLLPEDKVRVVEQTKAEGRGKLAFVGDGINDAPVIAAADVGVAMGALGSDAAIETSDVVLMTDMPSRMADAIGIGKRTRVLLRENIVFSLVVKAAFVSLGAAGLATMWEAVFADVGVAVLAVLNAARILTATSPMPPSQPG